MNSRFVRVVLSVFLVQSMVLAAGALEASPSKLTAVSRPARQFGTIPSLKKLAEQAHASGENPAAHEKKIKAINETNDRAPRFGWPPNSPPVQDPVVQMSLPHQPTNAPTFGVNFPGVANIDGVFPPDTEGSVGPTAFVQWVNLHIDMWDKTGVELLGGPIAGNALWQAALPGSNCAGQNSGDPITRYDSIANRWLISQLAFNAGNGSDQCIAISLNSDPTGSYYVYDFELSPNEFGDYPKFGVWPDAYYLTVNQFGNGLSTFDGAAAAAFDRNKMLIGDPTASLIYMPFPLSGSGNPFFAALPADLEGPYLPAPGSPGLFFVIDSPNVTGTVDQAFNIFAFHVDFVIPANSTFTLVNRILDPAAFNDDLCDGNSGGCVPQPGTAQGLDTLVEHPMYRAPYMVLPAGTASDPTPRDVVVLNQTVNTFPSAVPQTNNQAAVRWYEFHNPAGVVTIAQEGTYAGDVANTDYRWMASMAMNFAGSIAAGYSHSSSTLFPEIDINGRLDGDAAGLFTQGETVMQLGAGSQTGSDFFGRGRWGDYSDMSLDPSDFCTFWYTNEYLTTTDVAPWATTIASFTLPDGCTPPPLGTLSGTVTDSASNPIAGALVALDAGYSTATDGSGNYSMTVPAGSYNATASDPARSCNPSSPAPVSITAGNTTNQDFQLSGVGNLVFQSAAFDDSGGNNNGRIDPNECIVVNVDLGNTGCADTTGISAVLSSNTVGVVVAQPNSAYPDIAEGASVGNTTPFQISTAAVFTCGTPVNLTLTVNSSAGTNVYPIVFSTSVDYTFSQSTGAAIVPGTTNTGSSCDDCLTAITLPFPYTFYDQSFTSAQASSNGQLDFVTGDSSFINTCLPDGAASYAIFPLWQDQITTCGGCGIFTSTSGSAPNRTFNIEWRTNYFGGASLNNYEIILRENSPVLDIIYGTMSDAGGNATVGIQKDTGSVINQFECGTGGISSGLDLNYALLACAPGPGTCAGGVCPVITISPSTTFDGLVGQAYQSTTLTASGGTGPYAFGIQSGNLPPGLTLSAGGLLSGTPTAAGTYSFTVIVSDSVACGATQAYTIHIGTCDVILDGSFENEATTPAWTSADAVFGSPLCSAATCGTGGGTAGPRTGLFWMWFGGFPGSDNGSTLQAVTIPAGAVSPTLSFYFWLGNVGDGGAADTFTATVDATTIFSTDATSSAYTGGYTQVTADLSAFADGAPHTLTFSYVVADTAVPTNFNLDDVSLQVCPPPGLSLKYYTIAPCRLVDTRKPAGTYGGPALQGGTQRAFPITGQCGIPDDAVAVSSNLTVVNPSAGGDLRLFPTGNATPNSSEINFNAGRTRANNAVFAIDGPTAGSLTVQTDIPAAGTTQMILDVNGYFRFAGN